MSKKLQQELRVLCWETLFGQELVKLTVLDLIFTIFATLFMDFFRALFVRFMNKCWCWDLEKKFPKVNKFSTILMAIHSFSIHLYYLTLFHFSLNSVSFQIVSLIFAFPIFLFCSFIVHFISSFFFSFILFAVWRFQNCRKHFAFGEQSRSSVDGNVFCSWSGNFKLSKTWNFNVLSVLGCSYMQRSSRSYIQVLHIYTIKMIALFHFPHFGTTFHNAIYILFNILLFLFWFIYVCCVVL